MKRANILSCSLIHSFWVFRSKNEVILLGWFCLVKVFLLYLFHFFFIYIYLVWKGSVGAESKFSFLLSHFISSQTEAIDWSAHLKISIWESLLFGYLKFLEVLDWLI